MDAFDDLKSTSTPHLENVLFCRLFIFKMCLNSENVRFTAHRSLATRQASSIIEGSRLSVGRLPCTCFCYNRNQSLGVGDHFNKAL